METQYEWDFIVADVLSVRQLTSGWPQRQALMDAETILLSKAKQSTPHLDAISISTDM